MSVEDIFKKMKETEGIGDEEISELQEALDASTKVGSKGVKELKEAKAAQARILEEKKKLQAKNKVLEDAIEDVKNSDLSELDKSKKLIEKLTEARDKLESDLGTITELSDKNQREYKLDKIRGDLKFLDSIPNDMRDNAVRQAFESVEDLGDDEAVALVLAKFTESHKSVLASDTAARGSGSVSSENVSSSVTFKAPEKQSVDERAKAIADRFAKNTI